MKISKKYLIVSALNALLLILIGICLWRIHSYSNLLISQQIAQFWAGESKERFAQVSCYFPIGSAVDDNAINSFRRTIDKKLAEAGLEPKTEGEYWTDAYSTTSTIKVEGDRNSSDTTVIGVGGDFFSFHPYPLRSGSYIYETDLMKDRVVLDYELAWKLFGGEELEGMTVKINGKPYYVAGVIQRETDKFSNKTLTGDPMIFMAYSTLSEIKEGTSISVYEVAMPDPISKFAKKVTDEGFSSSKAVVVENSARYSFINIYNIIKNFGSRSIVSNAVIYPYWENAARVSEAYIARLYVLILVLSIVPLICLIILIIKFVKYILLKLKQLGFKLWDAWDDRYARQKARQERKTKKLMNTEQSVEEDSAEEKSENTEHKVKLTKLSLLANELKSFNNKLKHTPKKYLKKTTINSKKNKVTVKKSVETKENNYDEKEIALDIESIVREILYESNEIVIENKPDKIDKTQAK